VTVVAKKLVPSATHAEGACHRFDFAAPGVRPFGGQHVFHRAVDVVGKIQVKVTIAIGVEESTPCAPASVGDTCPLAGPFERTVAAIAIKLVRPKVRHIQIDEPVVVIVAGANAAAPAVVANTGFIGDILESAAAKISVQHVLPAQSYGRRFLVELPGVYKINVQQSIAIVVEHRNAGPSRFQNVILVRPSAIEYGSDPSFLRSIYKHRIDRR